MLLNLTLSDIEDCKRRLRQQRMRVESLKSLGMGSEVAEAELAQLSETLDHLEHHHRIFDLSVGECGGVKFGYC